MGTPADCMWATIYFAVHEKLSLTPKCNKQLMLFLRFIEDILGIWIGNPLEQSWEDVKNETISCGILEWEFEEPPKKVNFLDLTTSNRKRKEFYQNIPESHESIPVPQPQVQPPTWHDERHSLQPTKNLQKPKHTYRRLPGCRH